MKTLQRLLFLSAIVFLTFSSCSKKGDPKPAGSGNYLPTQSGNQWTYTGDIAYTLKMTGNTKVFNGNTYLEGETSYNGDISDGYVFVSDGNYYNRGLVSLGADSTASDTLEFIILKDNVPEGTTWTHATTIQDIAYVYAFSIDKKDFRYAVSGKTYDKVIKVKLDISFDFFGAPFLFATEYIYFAYEVGIIQTQVEVFGTSTLSSNLNSYDLK